MPLTMRKSILILFSITLLITACSDNRKHLSENEYGEDWPLTVNSGWVSCLGDPFVIIFETNGHTYAVNDAARATEKYEDIDAILRDDPNYPRGHVKMDVSMIEFEGLKLCNHRGK